jgi:hypothetical protein
MITKKQLLDSMWHETNVIKHLAKKIPEDGYGYRPSEGQRSTLELLQYMTRMAAGPATNVLTGSWDHAEQMEAETGTVTPETFPAEMDRQMAILERLLSDVDESEATTKGAKMPWGAPTTVAAALMDMPLKCFVAYRMQLFLYAKASGASGLGPANCWAGVDMPPPAE